MTVKPCNRPAIGAHRLGWIDFIDVFSFTVKKQTLGEVETKTLI